MKIAVCIFGICRGEIKENLERLKQHFPYDYFYGTWEGRESDIEELLPDVEYMTTPEPKMHYHPVLDVNANLYHHKYQTKDERLARLQVKCKQDSRHKEAYGHRSKQILGHAYMLSQLPEDYDMIIRTRFDTFPSLKVDFSPYITRAYEEKRAIGFAKFYPTIYNDKVDRLKEDPGYKTLLLDFIIMHRRDMFDINYAYQLHNEKKLHISEIGWYQVLSQPFGGSHISVFGGAILNREQTVFEKKP